MDKYDEQIAYLTNNPNQINKLWDKAEGLFKILGKNSNLRRAGCLTMIKPDENRAVPYYPLDEKGNILVELNKEIINDSGIPNDPFLITIEKLPKFAYYQRKYDALVAETTHNAIDDNDFHPDRDCYN